MPLLPTASGSLSFSMRKEDENDEGKRKRAEEEGADRRAEGGSVGIGGKRARCEVDGVGGSDAGFERDYDLDEGSSARAIAECGVWDGE